MKIVIGVGAGNLLFVCLFVWLVGCFVLVGLLYVGTWVGCLNGDLPLVRILSISNSSFEEWPFSFLKNVEVNSDHRFVALSEVFQPHWH